MFDDEEHPPDAEFGAFAVVLGQKGSPHEDTGLLQAMIGAGATPCCMSKASAWRSMCSVDTSCAERYRTC